MEQDKVQETHDNDRYICPHSTFEWQIRTDAMLSRQIYQEEQKQFEKHIKQVEYRRSNEYHFNSIGRHTIPNQTIFCMKR